MTPDENQPEPDLSPAEQAFAGNLERGRPMPAANFRGALGRHLLATDPGYGPRPARLRVIAGGLLGGGLAVMALGLLQATGSL